MLANQQHRPVMRHSSTGRVERIYCHKRNNYYYLTITISLKNLTVSVTRQIGHLPFIIRYPYRFLCRVVRWQWIFRRDYG